MRYKMVVFAATCMLSFQSIAIDTCQSAQRNLTDVVPAEVEIYCDISYGRITDRYCINLRQAAEQGNPKAQYQLGYLYGGLLSGMKNINYCPNYNLTEKRKWIQRSAENGYAEAQLELSRIYQQDGNKVLEQNWGKLNEQTYSAKRYYYTEAFKWLDKAARQGFLPAQEDMGTAYSEFSVYKGVVQQDPAKSSFWYSQACNHHTFHSNWSCDQVTYICKKYGYGCTAWQKIRRKFGF